VNLGRTCIVEVIQEKKMTDKEKEAAEGSSGEPETRPQQAGEGGTTRFGMEDGDNSDVPATGDGDGPRD
jgi:hypothetical protein